MWRILARWEKDEKRAGGGQTKLLNIKIFTHKLVTETWKQETNLTSDFFFPRSRKESYKDHTKSQLSSSFVFFCFCFYFSQQQKQHHKIETQGIIITPFFLIDPLQFQYSVSVYIRHRFFFLKIFKFNVLVLLTLSFYRSSSRIYLKRSRSHLNLFNVIVCVSVLLNFSLI